MSVPASHARVTVGGNGGYQTGYVLATYGDGWLSKVISWGTPRLKVWEPAPSHVAIVAVHEGDGLLVHESTTLSKLEDAIVREKRRGVQAHRLHDWLDTHNWVDLYPLKVPLTRAFDTAVYLRSVHARKLDYDARAAFHSASPVVNSATGDPLFCSALVGFALQKGGAIGSYVNCNELTPRDIVKLPCFAKPVRLKPMRRAA